MKLFPCELHCHTIHSDGDFTPTGLQTAARENELALVALTDHNTKSGVGELIESICPFIDAIEWTTYFGHMLVLGGTAWADWRDAVPENIDEKTARLKQGGAAIGVAHPFQLGSPMCTGGRWQFDVRRWENFDYIEVFHESFLPTDENKRAYALWRALLDSGHRLGATYGRDWHRCETAALPRGCTYIQSDAESITPAAALSAIKAGRTVPSVAPKLFFSAVQGEKKFHPGDTAEAGAATVNCRAELNARQRFTKNFNIQYDEIRISTTGQKTLFSLPAAGGAGQLILEKGAYITAELWGKIGKTPALLAVAGPIYTASVNS